MSYDLAKRILGPDFISPEQIARLRGFSYTEKQLAKFRDTLPAKVRLKWCHDNGMLLVAGPPKRMSLLDIRSVKADYFYLKQGGWYAEKAQRFANVDKVETIWIALSKEPVAGSPDKNWAEQAGLVREPKSVPNTAEVVWCFTTYKAVRGKSLLKFKLPNRFVRTSSVGSDGNHVSVGHFSGDDLVIYDDRDFYRYSDLGVSAARKF